MTDHEDRKLREAAQASWRLEGGGAACPEPDRLRLSARGSLPAGEQERVVLHLSTCGGCAAAWRVARELEPAGAGRRSWAPFLAAAAALVLAAAAGVWFLGEGAPAPPPTFRNQGEPWLRSEVSQEALPRDRFTLRWTGGPEGTAYDLRVLRVNLDVLYRTNGLAAPSHTVPPEALEDLESGAKLLWQVSARLPDGSTSVSGTFVTQVE